MPGSPSYGTVFLIGAGPGDPGLLTLRGAELLARCDVVLYDGLSNPDLLRHAPEAEHICVGKHGQSRIWKQDEIIAETIRHAQAGRTVGRLKGGDPAIFARTSEEVEALTAAGIDFEIVPGITAALAAGSYAGIPITDRRLASAVALVTGHEQPGKSQSTLDWRALASFPGTLVIYMGVTSAADWTGQLLAAGKPPETPAALVRRCSLSDQQTIHCRLDEVVQRLTPASKMRPPVIVILGPVTQLATTMDWVRRRPLHGQHILVTRPQGQNDELAEPLTRLGATVTRFPVIEIGSPEDQSAVDNTIAALEQFDVIAFSSRNGVQYFLDRMIQLGKDMRRLAGIEIAAVGQQTAAALARYHLRADLVPDDYRAASLAHQLAPTANGKRFLLIRASRGGDDLRQGLIAAGGIVSEVVAYSHRDVTVADPEVARQLDEGKFDWLTITSSGSAKSLFQLFGDHLLTAKIASLSPVTSDAIRRLGLQVSAEADPYTMTALVDAIAAASQ